MSDTVMDAGDTGDTVSLSSETLTMGSVKEIWEAQEV